MREGEAASDVTMTSSRQVGYYPTSIERPILLAFCKSLCAIESLECWKSSIWNAYEETARYLRV